MEDFRKLKRDIYDFTDPEKRRRAHCFLGYLGDRRAIEAVIKGLRPPDDEV